MTALSWIRVLTMSIGWMQHVATEPAIEPTRKGLAEASTGLSSLMSKEEGSANDIVGAGSDH